MGLASQSAALCVVRQSFQGLAARLAQHRQDQQARKIALAAEVQALVMNLCLLAVMVLSALNVIEGRMQIGDLTAVMLMLLSLYAPLNIL